jgi:hypothetical protein
MTGAAGPAIGVLEALRRRDAFVTWLDELAAKFAPEAKRRNLAEEGR